MQQGGFHNTVKLRGMVAEPLKESHVTYGERFYATRLRVPRLSHACDLLPITISERLLSGYMPQVDSIVTIIGQLRKMCIRDRRHSRAAFVPSDWPDRGDGRSCRCAQAR